MVSQIYIYGLATRYNKAVIPLRNPSVQGCIVLGVQHIVIKNGRDVTYCDAIAFVIYAITWRQWASWWLFHPLPANRYTLVWCGNLHTLCKLLSAPEGRFISGGQYTDVVVGPGGGSGTEIRERMSFSTVVVSCYMLKSILVPRY